MPKIGLKGQFCFFWNLSNKTIRKFRQTYSTCDVNIKNKSVWQDNFELFWRLGQFYFQNCPTRQIRLYVIFRLYIIIYKYSENSQHHPQPVSKRLSKVTFDDHSPIEKAERKKPVSSTPLPVEELENNFETPNELKDVSIVDEDSYVSRNSISKG